MDGGGWWWVVVEDGGGGGGGGWWWMVVVVGGGVMCKLWRRGYREVVSHHDRSLFAVRMKKPYRSKSSVWY